MVHCGRELFFIRKNDVANAWWRSSILKIPKIKLSEKLTVTLSRVV